jgi:WD40 repeat protein
VLGVRFSPDGKTVVTASADRSIKVWEAGGKLLRTLTQHTEIVHCLAIRPTTEAGAADAPPWSCASGSDDKTVRIWQPGIGRMVRIVRKHEGAIFALAYTSSGVTLFSAGADGVIRAIDADSDQIRFEFKGHDDWIYALAVSPDGKSLVSGDWAGNFKLWQLDDTGAKPAW